MTTHLRHWIKTVTALKALGVEDVDAIDVAERHSNAQDDIDLSSRWLAICQRIACVAEEKAMAALESLISERIEQRLAEEAARAAEAIERLTRERDEAVRKLGLPHLGDNLMQKPTGSVSLGAGRFARIREAVASEPHMPDGGVWRSARGQHYARAPRWVIADVIRILLRHGGPDNERSGAFSAITKTYGFGGATIRLIWADYCRDLGLGEDGEPETAERRAAGGVAVGPAMPAGFVERV